MKKAFLGLLILMSSCSGPKSSQETSVEFLPGKKLAELKNKDLEEISGIASSSNNPHMLWVHNDSGNKAEVFLIDEKLDIKLICKLKGVENRDWEDIAVGPGPEPNKKYIYIADIGDNDTQYQVKFIYRFEEPTWGKSQQKTVSITDFDRISFQLSDEEKDTEALLIDYSTKDLYVVSKRENPVHVYELKFPHSTEDILTANKLLSLPFTQIVGADFSSDGKEVLMKNYNSIFYWKSSTQKPLSEILTLPAKEVPYEVEPQGEAIAWAHDGSGFYTLSEKKTGLKSFLYFYQRKSLSRLKKN